MRWELLQFALALSTMALFVYLVRRQRRERARAPAKVEPYPYLSQLLGGYFHQDCYDDGESNEDILREFVRTSHPEQVRGACADLERFLAQYRGQLREAVERELSPDVILGNDDAEVEAWLREAQRVLGATDPEFALDLPIDGVLDLHTFAPRDVGTLVPEWIDACRARGIRELRIIHGKGKGELRRHVHAILARRPDVLEVRAAPPDRGGWGATLVTLREHE